MDTFYGKSRILLMSSLLFIVALGLCEASTNATADNNQTAGFVATNEWQIVGEGQAIPQGLHVRINLQTGLKEAKLLDEDETKRTALQADSAAAVENNNNEALALDYKPDLIEESLSKVRAKHNYAELRKAYKEFQKNFRTDSEVIAEILNQYRNFSKLSLETELKAKLNILENLEYMLHQIDNALIFIDGGGLSDVLLPIVVNETNPALRVSAMRVLGALTGNNPKAQIKVFELNFGSHLAQILMTSSNHGELSAALHAFGALLRKFPLAQQRILSTSGTQALIRVLTSIDVDLRVKAKAITLISDLVQEKRFVLDASMSGADPSTIAQYVLLELESWLQAQDYCAAVDTLLSTDFGNMLEQPDIVEQFAIALDNTVGLCQSLWLHSPQLRHALLTLRNRFMHSEDEYRLEVSQTLTRICTNFYEKHRPHTEL